MQTMPTPIHRGGTCSRWAAIASPATRMKYPIMYIPNDMSDLPSHGVGARPRPCRMQRFVLKMRSSTERREFAMHKFWNLTVGSLVFFCAASSLSAAPQFGRQRGRQAQVCLYQDIQYRGVEQCFNAGETISTLQNLNGRPSSIRIYGDASVTVYDETNYRGHSTVLTSSVPDLARVRLEGRTWNDRIRSMQINGGNAYNGPYGNSPVYGGSTRYPNQYPDQPLSRGVCVYDR